MAENLCPPADPANDAPDSLAPTARRRTVMGSLAGALTAALVAFGWHEAAAEQGRNGAIVKHH